jgi:hypothetical protein
VNLTFENSLKKWHIIIHTKEMSVSLHERFPQIDLSYETDAHKKVLTNQYDLCLSIPTGKKSFAWFTYRPGTAINTCYIADMKIAKFTEVQIEPYEFKLALKTILYGTICELNGKKFFVMEDMFYYCGLPVRQMTYGDKLTYFHQMLSRYLNQLSSCELIFTMPYFRKIADSNINDILTNPIFYDEMVGAAAYLAHHVQFRSSTEILPYLNHNYKKTATKTLDENNSNLSKDFVMKFPLKNIDYGACSQKREAVFQVMADLESDIYHLYCYDGKNREDPYIYFDIAYVGTRKESVFMNTMFRNIRENSNIDLGEESEDEDMFQTIGMDKYVDLNKKLKILCIYNDKWRKWVPKNVVADSARVANVNELTRRQPYASDQSQGQQRPVYNNQGNNRPYQNNNQRPAYNNQGNNQRLAYNNQGNNQRPAYNNQGNNQRPAYNNQGNSQRPAYNNQGSNQRPPYNNQGNNKPV